MENGEEEWPITAPVEGNKTSQKSIEKGMVTREEVRWSSVCTWHNFKEGIKRKSCRSRKMKCFRNGNGRENFVLFLFFVPSAAFGISSFFLRLGCKHSVSLIDGSRVCFGVLQGLSNLAAKNQISGLPLCHLKMRSHFQGPAHRAPL